MISSRGFAEQVVITNPGSAPADGTADLWRNDQVETDSNGTVLSDWIGLFPPATVIAPFAEVVQLSGGRVFWVYGETETRRSLLTGVPDHIEARLRAAFRFLTTVDVYRDSDTSDTTPLGDPVETGTTPIITGLPISITEVKLAGPTETDERTAHTLVGWVAAAVDVRRGDRLLAAGGVWYAVEKVTPPTMGTGLRDLRLDLSRVT